MPPGAMPVPCSVALPSSAASRIGAALRSLGYSQPTGVTTFLPDRSSAATSSGLAISGA